MATVLAPTTKTIPAYPAPAIAIVLQDELIGAIRRRFRRKGTPVPKDEKDIVVLVIEIDSLTVVELLSSLDDFLPFKVTESAVRAGGYRSIAEAVVHVTARVESQWKKYHTGGKP